MAGPAAQGSRLGGGGGGEDEGEQDQQLLAFAGVVPLHDEQAESGEEEGEEGEGQGQAQERRWRATISAPLDEQANLGVWV